MTKLAAKLPTENGLDACNSSMVADTERAYLVVGVVRPVRITTDVETGLSQATAAFQALEVISGPDLVEADAMLRHAEERRTGQASLPLKLDTTLSRVLAAVVDPVTGELLWEPDDDDADHSASAGGASHLTVTSSETGESVTFTRRDADRLAALLEDDDSDDDDDDGDGA